MLQSILTGRFDPGGQAPGAAWKARNRCWPGPRSDGLTTLAGTGIERSRGRIRPRADAAPRSTVRPPGERNRPRRRHPPAPALSSSASPSSSSAILPGGTQLSSVESGRHAFFRSLAQIGRQVAGGLAYAHARGIVHRDIKPSNLLLDTEGVVWITDFGLAKGDDEGLTQTGDILGTIRYMAPERFRGEGDARADVYALGLTLYELLTLRPGFASLGPAQADRADQDRGAAAAAVDRRADPARPGDDRLEGDREGPEGAVPVGRGDGRGPQAVPRRRADPGPSGQRRGAILAVGPAQSGDRRARRQCSPAVLLVATVSSLLAMERFRTQAETQHGCRRSRASEAGGPRARPTEANASLRATQEELRRTVYATRSNLALAAWDAADVGRLRSLLDLLRPAPGEPDLRGWEWRYLWQLGHEDRLTLRAQEDSFIDVAFSPDGQTLAGLEAQGRIQLWDRQHRGIAADDRGHDSGPARGSGRRRRRPRLQPRRPQPRRAGPRGEPDALRRRHGPAHAHASRAPPDAVLRLAWSPDGRTLVAALVEPQHAGLGRPRRPSDPQDLRRTRRPGRRRRVQPRRPHHRLGQL